jgi:hypothetical protein
MKSLAPWFMAIGGAIVAITTALAGARGAFAGTVPLAPYLYGYAVAIAAFLTGGVLYLRQGQDLARPYFSLEVAAGELHPYTQVTSCFFVRNCGQRAARHITFDPIKSRRGLKIWIDEIASVAPGDDRIGLGFRAGDNREYKGTVGHLVNFFEGGCTGNLPARRARKPGALIFRAS